jgi:NADH:ubiquinone oxidoreductase subunit F (NADH-binding)
MAPGKTICALSDAAAIPTLSAIRLFKSELEECVRQHRDPISYQRIEYAGAH